MASKLARDVRTVPNLITLSRIVLLLAGAGLYFYVSTGAGIAVSALAGATDYLDGKIARATGQVTFLGEVLDHFCDLCFESLILLIAVSQGFFPPLVLFLYLFREFWVTCLRRFLAASGENLRSGVLGKLKTNLLMWGFLPTFLSISGALPSLDPWLGHLGRLSIGLGLLVSYAGGWSYTRAFFAAYDRAAAKA